MKVSTILDHIDDGGIALPEFQRGYVWNRGAVHVLVPGLSGRELHDVVDGCRFRGVPG